MPAPAILDASAVLALLLKEPGGEAVEPYVGVGHLSVVNYAEIVARLSERGVPTELIAAQVATLGLKLVVFDSATAFAAGMLRTATKEFGLSLGDRACLATAIANGMHVVTADHEWDALNLGVKIETIRKRRE